MRLRRLVARTAALAISGLALVAASLLAAPAAYAAPQVEFSVNGAAFSTTPATALLNFDRLAPGSATAGLLGVRNPYADGGTLALQLANVHEFENGCLRPELAAGDASCGNPGDGHGELGDALEFTVEVGDPVTNTWTQTWAGSKAQLLVAAHVGITVPGGTDRYLRITAALPWAVGNEVQTDSIGFDLAVMLESTAGNGGGVVPGNNGNPGPGGTPGGGSGSAGGGSGVGGGSAGPSNSGSGIGGVAVGPSGPGGTADLAPTGRGVAGLARTGTSAAMLTGSGLLALLCGALILSAARDRRRRAV